MFPSRTLLFLALTLAACGKTADDPDGDGDGWGASEDCDDGDASRFPGAVELPADGVDQNCDTLELCYFDGDEDGYGTDFQIGSDDLDCTNRHGEATTTTDCDDVRSFVHPDANELPGNGIDEDCNGTITCFVDDDGDGSGGTDTMSEDDGDCGDEMGQSRTADDCDDADPLRFPGAEEVVGDTIDQDCDAELLCFVDGDRDGFGSEDTGTTGAATCDTDGFSDVSGDCVDDDPAVIPGAPRTIQASAYPTINDAVAAACTGDTIQLDATTYSISAPLDLGDLGLTLAGAGREATMVQYYGPASSPAITLAAGAVKELTLYGTGSNDGARAGGILVKDAEGVELTDLGVGGFGGNVGCVFVEDAKDVVIDTIAMGNCNGSPGPGAIEILQSQDVSVSGASISYSGSGGSTGGIAVFESEDVALEDLQLAYLSGSDAPGALYVGATTGFELTHLRVSSASGSGVAAAVRFDGVEGEASDLEVRDTSSGASAAVALSGQLTVSGLAVLNTQSASAVAIEGTSADDDVAIINGALLGSMGNGVSVGGTAGSARLTNLLIGFSGNAGIAVTGDVTPEITYNYVFRNSGGHLIGMDVSEVGVGNLADEDPYFLRATIWVYSWMDWGQWDYHLLPASPLRDAGDPTVLDQDGSRSDIGWYGGKWADLTGYADTDTDGMYDAWEYQYGLNVGTDDGGTDNDGDNLTCLQEFEAGTNPWSSDTDSDMYRDDAEVQAGTNPRDPNDHP